MSTELTMPCRKCKSPVRWTSLYGDWCPVCSPRDQEPSDYYDEEPRDSGYYDRFLNPISGEEK